MKIRGIFLIGIISIKTLGILSCSGKQDTKDVVTSKMEINNQVKNIINKIEVRKVDFLLTSIVRIDCDEYENHFNSFKEIYMIENPDSINLFMNIINNLQRDTAKYDFNYSPDVRAKLLVYHENNILDTLCMDSRRIMLNQELYIMDERLLKMIEK